MSSITAKTIYEAQTQVQKADTTRIPICRNRY